jgi:hypothetical protein
MITERSREEFADYVAKYRQDREQEEYEKITLQPYQTRNGPPVMRQEDKRYYLDFIRFEPSYPEGEVKRFEKNFESAFNRFERDNSDYWLPEVERNIRNESNLIISFLKDKGIRAADSYANPDFIAWHITQAATRTDEVRIFIQSHMTRIVKLLEYKLSILRDHKKMQDLTTDRYSLKVQEEKYKQCKEVLKSLR